MSCREMTTKASWQLLFCSVLQEKQRFKLMLYRRLEESYPNVRSKLVRDLGMCFVLVSKMCLFPIEDDDLSTCLNQALLNRVVVCEQGLVCGEN